MRTTSFIKDIQLKGADCEFETVENIKDTLIRDRIICGLQDKHLQEKLLRMEDDKLTLEKVISACRAHEEAMKSTKILKSSNRKQ